MGIVGLLLLILFVASALFLVLFILIQDEQGEGMGGIFGGGGGGAFGPRSGNVLTKITSVLAIIFLTGAFGLAWINRTPEAGNIVGKARVETLKESKKDWWVETSNTAGKQPAAGEKAVTPEKIKTGQKITTPKKSTSPESKKE